MELEAERGQTRCLTADTCGSHRMLSHVETLKRLQRFMRPTGEYKLERVREYRPDGTHEDCPKVRRGAEEKERGYQAE
jgi:hypothetical protein